MCTGYGPTRVRRREIKAVIWVQVHDADTANLGSSRRRFDRAVSLFLTSFLSSLQNPESSSVAAVRYSKAACSDA
jgi:hypothetical protein